MQHLPIETQRRLTTLTLDRLLDFAEDYVRSDNHQGRFEADNAAYDFLFFYGKETKDRFIDNYTRLKDEVKS